ncbi:hypothetical protein ACFSDD_07925 [Salipiger marinus]|uniref:hypothetical protein n=1 Tax=Salipiger marinus TaxID=555512 RepID=UPI002B9FD331|nr:hypothetical protein [Salipiger manganoxidans]MEB3419416.1 hypothetical protein [Salipiger manganoxidans]
MYHSLIKFLKSETGAVTIDWVVLIASVVAMTAISFYQIRDNAANMDVAAGNAVAQEQAALFGE